MIPHISSTIVTEELKEQAFARARSRRVGDIKRYAEENDLSIATASDRVRPTQEYIKEELARRFLAPKTVHINEAVKTLYLTVLRRQLTDLTQIKALEEANRELESISDDDLDDLMDYADEFVMGSFG